MKRMSKQDTVSRRAWDNANKTKVSMVQQREGFNHLLNQISDGTKNISRIRKGKSIFEDDSIRSHI